MGRPRRAAAKKVKYVDSSDEEEGEDPRVSESESVDFIPGAVDEAETHLKGEEDDEDSADAFSANFKSSRRIARKPAAPTPPRSFQSFPSFISSLSGKCSGA